MSNVVIFFFWPVFFFFFTSSFSRARVLLRCSGMAYNQNSPATLLVLSLISVSFDRYSTRPVSSGEHRVLACGWFVGRMRKNRGSCLST